MTRQAIHTDTMTPYSLWLRQLARPLDSSVFSNHNLDYVWHNYRENWLLLMEEKRFGATCTPSQRDTHGVVDQMLSYASGMTVNTLRGRRMVEYRGYYLVQFSATTPDDSEWIRINGTNCTRSDLIGLLRTGYLVELAA